MGKHAKFKVLLPVCAQQQGETQFLLSHISPFGHTMAHTISVGDRLDFKVKRNLLVRLEAEQMDYFCISMLNVGQPTMLFITEVE